MSDIKNVLYDVFKSDVEKHNKNIREYNKKIIVDMLVAKHGGKAKYNDHNLKNYRFLANASKKEMDDFLNKEQEFFDDFATQVESKIKQNLEIKKQEQLKESSYKKAIEISISFDNSINIAALTDGLKGGNIDKHNEQSIKKYNEIKEYFDKKYEGKNSEINSLLEKFENKFPKFSPVKSSLKEQKQDIAPKSSILPNLSPVVKPSIHISYPNTPAIKKQTNAVKNGLVNSVNNNAQKVKQLQQEIAKLNKLNQVKAKNIQQMKRLQAMKKEQLLKVNMLNKNLKQQNLGILR